MRSTHTIDEILGTPTKIQVLRVLRGVRIPLNASQIAARIGMSRPAVATALRELGSMGLVGSSSAGKANVHLLVRDNVFVEQLVEPLFAGEERVSQVLIDELEALFMAEAESVALFGSYARGDQQPSSDVDVVVVTPDAHSKRRAEEQADDRAYDFHQRFGATLSAFIYTLDEAAALGRTAPALADSIQRDAVVVCGRHPREWVSSA